MAKLKTHEEFIEDLKVVNPTIEVLGKYVNSRTKIEVRCLVCNHTWETVTQNIIKNKNKNNSKPRGCPKCANTKRTMSTIRTLESFKDELYNIDKNIEINSDYVGANKHIHCTCKVCGHSWKAYPTELLRGSGCIVCVTKSMTKEKEILTEQLYKIRLC